MRDRDTKARKITYIALGISALIVGGIAIYQISALFPMPGFKYILMAPYLSMVIYIVVSKLKTKFGILKVGLVFGMVMATINIFMMVAIVATTFLTQISILPIPSERKGIMVGSVLFSAYTGSTALFISKYLIGGVFAAISNGWVLAVGALCLVFGLIGTWTAKRIIKQINGYHSREGAN